MNLSSKCLIKWFLFFIHLFLSIVGALILVLGVMLLILLRSLPDELATQTYFIPILVITYGCVLTVTNICGSYDKKICHLMYTVVMAIFASISLILAILVFVISKRINDIISELLTEWFHDEVLRGNFALIETYFECCGLTGPESYLGSIPLSCCPSDLDPFSCFPTTVYQDGCLYKVSHALRSDINNFGTIMIILSIFGFLASGTTLFYLYLKKKR